MLQKNLKPPITWMNTDTKKLARAAFAARMGQDKPKTLQASLIDFCFFSANPSLLGSFALLATRSLHPSGHLRCASSRMPKALGCANPRIPWLVFSNRDRELLIIKLQYVAFI